MPHRQEKDCLGIVQVPKKAFYGSFTTRAKENFPITGQTMPEPFWQALTIVKKAGIITNSQLRLLNKQHVPAMKQACDEIIAGKFNDQIVIDRYQAGAGTPFNMNINEIIANRANQILKGKKGQYKYVHPNNDVNMSQSTNDVIPTTGRIAALLEVEKLYPEIQRLSQAFQKIAKSAGNTVKVGRTHLEDAVPIKVSQEFNAFADNISKNLKRIQIAFEELKELGIGATALGSGINTHPDYAKKMTTNLSKLTKLKLFPTKNRFELTQSMDAFVNASSALRIYAIDMIKIANDLKLLNMGPKAGLHEITLPEVQPGSSIMPGKVNPSIEECVHQVGYQVMGYDYTIAISAQAGQLQLNVMGPVIILNLLMSLELLTNTTKMWTEKSIQGIKINHQKIKNSFENSLCIATALNPFIGYEVTAEIVKEGLETSKNIIELITEKELLTEKQIKEILSPLGMTHPRKINQKMIKQIHNNPNFIKYKQSITKK